MTKNIVPRADGEGNIGTSAKKWLKGWFGSIFLGNLTAGKMIKTSSGNVPEDGTNTDTDVADAVTKKHSQNTDTHLGTVDQDIPMNTHKFTGLSVPVSEGDSIRETTKITEANLEDAHDKKHSQNTDTGSDADPFTLTGKSKRSSQVGITAHAGGGQPSAVEITKDIAEISICATEGDSVKLPAAVAGLVILITNHGAAAADVFPNTDDTINEEAANTAKSLGINASMLCIAYDATNWECLTLAR